MSRYAILLIINAPFVLAGSVNALVNYKLGKISRRRFLLQLIMWVTIFAGLASAQAIYRFLFSNKLTQTEPLSLFDVIQITGIVMLFFITNRMRTKVESLERRLNDLHQELSIRLSINEDKPGRSAVPGNHDRKH